MTITALTYNSPFLRPAGVSSPPKSLAGLFLVLVVLAMAMLMPGSPASAKDNAGLEALISSIADGSYGDRAKVVAEIGASGDARAVPVLQALAKKKLFQVKEDNRIVIADKKGKVYTARDALTGEAVGEFSKKELKPAKANNKVRKAVKAAIGGLGLFSDDAATRLSAAGAVFTSADPGMRVAVETAIAKEQDADIKTALLEAQAAIDLTSKDLELRRAAIAVLEEMGSPKVKAMLITQLAKEKDDGLKTALQEAIDSIDDTLANWQLVGNLYQGLSLGSVLLLAAVGLAITFGVMGVINMAHGEMVMLGAYTTWGVQQIILSVAPGMMAWSLVIAIPAAFMVAGLAGIAIERGIIRWLYGRPLETLLATWGLSLILQQTVRSLFGPTNKEVIAPGFMSGAIETTAGITLTYNRLWIILFALLVLAGLMLLLKKTSFGLQLRAVTQNRRMASAMGIATGKVDAMTFGLGSGIAGMAGVALSQIDNVSPNLGQAYIIDSFMVVVFGGVGNLLGTFAGAISLGVANKFLEPVSGAVLAKILILVAIILFIQKRPRGMFAPKGRAVEA